MHRRSDSGEDVDGEACRQADGTKKAARKRRRKSKPAQDYARYVMAIEGWDWALNFGVTTSRFDPGPYEDYRQLHLRGRLLIPSRIKVDAADVFLMPHAIMDADSWTG